MVAAAGPLNRFGGGRHLWLATMPVAESPLNGGLSVANEAQPIFFPQVAEEDIWDQSAWNQESFRLSYGARHAAGVSLKGPFKEKRGVGGTAQIGPRTQHELIIHV